MPQWLLTNEEYVPLKDRDSFIDKSILAMLESISKLILSSKGKKKIFNIDANIKVISALLIVILAAVSRSMVFILTINIILLMVVSLLNINEIKNILSVSSITAIFTAVILIPSILMGNISNSILIILKVIATVTVINVLSHVTEWNKITGTLKIFLIPDVFIFVFDITVKYILILGDLSLNMLYSLKFRSVGKSKDKYASLSGIMGTVFIKSKEMAEEMHSAMECRGFTGEYRRHNIIKFGLKEFIFIGFNLVIIFIYTFFK